MIELFLRTSLTSACILASVVGPSTAQESWTGNSLLEGCRVVSTRLTPDADLFAAGVCAGEIKALASIAGTLKDEQLQSCIPSQIGPRQLAKVVVSYLDHHHAILYQQLSVLILSALADAWPCHDPK
jgi:Rap1a immunity proteins